ncbi:hypothetical protein COOONC_28249, partial [Cooperia oncophora]
MENPNVMKMEVKWTGEVKWTPLCVTDGERREHRRQKQPLHKSLRAESQVSVLIRHLLENGYNANDRPVLNENETLNLSISANGLSLLRMDQAEETATFSAEFILQWNDAFLKWDPDEHGGQTRVKIKEVEIAQRRIVECALELSGCSARRTWLHVRGHAIGVGDLPKDDRVRGEEMGKTRSYQALRVALTDYEAQNIRVSIHLQRMERTLSEFQGDIRIKDCDEHGTQVVIENAGVVEHRLSGFRVSRVVDGMERSFTFPPQFVLHAGQTVL